MYDIVEMVSIWFIALRWALYSTVLILPAAICKFPSFCVLVLYLRDFWLQIYSYLFIFFSFTHIGFLNSFFVLEFKFYLALIFLKTCTPCIPEWSTLIDTSSNRETMIFFSLIDHLLFLFLEIDKKYSQCFLMLPHLSMAVTIVEW